jgi:MORN repeat
VYEGSWADGRPHGEGVMRCGKPNAYSVLVIAVTAVAYAEVCGKLNACSVLVITVNAVLHADVCGKLNACSVLAITVNAVVYDAATWLC